MYPFFCPLVYVKEFGCSAQLQKVNERGTTFQDNLQNCQMVVTVHTCTKCFYLDINIPKHRKR